MKLTIVGLGVVGTSVGLALKAATSEIPITGHDPEPERARRAKELGAIDQSHWNLIAACEQADLILLDLGLDELAKTLAALRGNIRAEAVLIDTFPIKRPVLEQVERVMPGTGQFVGGHIVSPRLARGSNEPSRELVQGATFYLIATSHTTAQALDIASNLAVALGASPMYADVAEHDGLVAATRQLPLVGALALVNSIAGQPGSLDRARAAGGELQTLACLVQNASAAGLVGNADNVLHWLDLYAAELAELRRLLAAREQAALEDRLARAAQSCEQWQAPDETKRPEDAEGTTSSTWRDMFLGSLGRRKSKPR